MESKTGVIQDSAQANVLRVESAIGSQNARSLAHSIEQIKLQANVSKTTVPRMPAVTTPVMTLQACLDDTVSGVSFARDVMLAGISHINKVIHKMSREQVLTKLAELNLDPRGTLMGLRQRLKCYYKRQRITEYHQMLPYSKWMQFEYVVVVDFQATCDKYGANFVQEIIEFSALFVNVRDRTIRRVFRYFCKPRVNPVLTSFCTSVTGITQAQVDDAMDFTEVLRVFQGWLFMLNLGPIFKFAIVTDGSWDMAGLFKNQVELSGIDLPGWARQWVNIRKVYSAFYDCYYVSLQELSKSITKFQIGRNSGLDNAINMTSLAVKLLNDGCIFTFNEHFRYDAFNVQLSRPSETLDTCSSVCNETQDESLLRVSEPINTNPSSAFNDALDESLSRALEHLTTSSSAFNEAQDESLSRASKPLNTSSSAFNEAQDDCLSRALKPLNTSSSAFNEAQDDSLSRASKPLNTSSSAFNEAQDESLLRASEHLNTSSSAFNEAQGQDESHRDQDSRIDMKALFLHSLSISILLLLMAIFQGYLNP